MSSGVSVTNKSSISSYIIIGFGVITFGLFITGYSILGKSSDKSWNEQKREMMTIVWPIFLIAFVLLFVISSMIIMNTPNASLFFLMGICSFTLAFSLASMMITLISK